MRQPYVYMCPVGGQLVPWLCSQADLLASDWQNYEAP
ncbi:MAG: Thoeris anti-defense Tad2 family protein [Giesbergeria sp.]